MKKTIQSFIFHRNEDEIDRPQYGFKILECLPIYSIPHNHALSPFNYFIFHLYCIHYLLKQKFIFIPFQEGNTVFLREKISKVVPFLAL